MSAGAGMLSASPADLKADTTLSWVRESNIYTGETWVTAPRLPHKWNKLLSIVVPMWNWNLEGKTPLIRGIWFVFPSIKWNHHWRPEGYLCFPAAKSTVFPANRFPANGISSSVCSYHIYGDKLLWICRDMWSMGAQLGCLTKHPVCSAQRCL